MEIDSFTKQDRPCFISDGYFAQFVGVSIRSVRNALRQLEEQGLIENSGFDGRKRYLKSTLMRQTLPNDTATAADPLGKDCLPIRQPLPSYTANVAEEKNKEKNIEKTNDQIVLPWAEPAFEEIWRIWLDDRRERKLKKYTSRGEQAALHKLYNDCAGDVSIAIQAIQNSIAHGYQGIFPPKGKQRTKPTFNSQAFDEWVDS